MKAQGPQRPARGQPIGGVSKFVAGSTHPGVVGKYFFGKDVRNNEPLGVFVDFGAGRPGIVFDHGQNGLLTGERVAVKIIKIKGHGSHASYDLELVSKLGGPEQEIQPTDIGSFLIFPSSVYPAPEGFTGGQFDALVPKELAKFSVEGSEEYRHLIEEGLIITCSLNQKQYRFLAQKCIWETVVALAKGEKVLLKIGQYCLGTGDKHYIHHPAIPAYDLARGRILYYENVRDGEERLVFLNDHSKFSLVEVAKQLAEGRLTLSLVPKPRQGLVHRVVESCAGLSPWRVKILRKLGEEEFWQYYLLPYFFGQMYKMEDEIEFIIIGEYVEHRNQGITSVVCAPVRELKQLEQSIETLRQGAEAEIMETGYQGSYSARVKIRVDSLIFPVQIIFNDAPVRAFSVGQKVRLTLDAEIIDKPFRGQELFYMGMLAVYAAGIPLRIAD